jgi:hypothetical protein
VIAGGGHLMLFDSPALVGPCVAEFLAADPSSRRPDRLAS